MALRVAICSAGVHVGTFVPQPATPVAAHAASQAALSPFQRWNRAVHAARAAAPRAAAVCRYALTTGSGAKHATSGGSPSFTLVAAISSGGKGSPWALGLSVNFSEG